MPETRIKGINICDATVTEADISLASASVVSPIAAHSFVMWDTANAILKTSTLANVEDYFDTKYSLLNHTHTVFTGNTLGANGVGGIVPQPLAGTTDKVLSSGGAWLPKHFFAVTPAGDTAGRWTATVTGVNSYYDGLRITIYNTTTYNGTYNTLNINGLGEKLIWYRPGSRLTSHFGAANMLTLTYSSNAGTYSTFTGGFVLDSSYQDGSESYTQRYNYYAPYSGSVGMPQYKFWAYDIDGKAQPFTTTAGTGTTKPINTCVFRLSTGIYYNGYSANKTANQQLQAAYQYTMLSTSEFHYTHNGISAPVLYAPIYIKATPVTADTFTLDDTSLTSWLTQTLPTTEDGYIYIYIGRLYSSANNFLLEAETPAYHYKDGAIRVWNNNYIASDTHNHDDRYYTETESDARYALTGHNHSGVYQPLDADLTAIAALAGTSGYLKKTAANTWELDTMSSTLPSFVVNNLAEFNAAYTSIRNNYGGGNIYVVGDIIMTAHMNLNLTGIDIYGMGGVWRFHNGHEMAPTTLYYMQITDGSPTFHNMIFYGSDGISSYDYTTGTSRNIFVITPSAGNNTVSKIITFRGCSFNDVVCGVSNSVIFVNAAMNQYASINFNFDNCKVATHGMTAGGLAGFFIAYSHASTSTNINVNVTDQRSGSTDETSLLYVLKKLSTSTAAWTFNSDETAWISSASDIANITRTNTVLKAKQAASYTPATSYFLMSVNTGDGNGDNICRVPATALSTGITPAALTRVNDTNVTLTLGGTPNTALLQAVSLTLGWTGTLADGRIASASTWNTTTSTLNSHIGSGGTAHANATTSVAGFMSATDKTNLNTLMLHNHTLANLSDVTFTSTTNKDTLIYNSSSSKWINTPSLLELTTIDEYTNVITPVVANRHISAYGFIALDTYPTLDIITYLGSGIQSTYYGISTWGVGSRATSEILLAGWDGGDNYYYAKENLWYDDANSALHLNGDSYITALVGADERMVTVKSDGKLSTMSLPTSGITITNQANYRIPYCTNVADALTANNALQFQPGASNNLMIVEGTNYLANSIIYLSGGATSPIAGYFTEVDPTIALDLVEENTQLATFGTILRGFTGGWLRFYVQDRIAGSDSLNVAFELKTVSNGGLGNQVHKRISGDALGTVIINEEAPAYCTIPLDVKTTATSNLGLRVYSTGVVNSYKQYIGGTFANAVLGSDVLKVDGSSTFTGVINAKSKVVIDENTTIAGSLHVGGTSLDNSAYKLQVTGNAFFKGATSMEYGTYASGTIGSGVGFAIAAGNVNLPLSNDVPKRFLWLGNNSTSTARTISRSGANTFNVEGLASQTSFSLAASGIAICFADGSNTWYIYRVK